MGKAVVNQVQEAQRVSSRINPRRNTPRHTVIKLTKIAEKDSTLYFEKILTNDSKVVEKKVDQVDKETGIIYKVTLSVEENIGKFVETGEN